MSETDEHAEPGEISAQRSDDSAKVHELAVAQVRRATDQHQCQAPKTGSCAHPNHRRDADYLSEMLAMIDLHHPGPAEDLAA